MLEFNSSLAPNPMKVALFLEESGLPCEPIPVDPRKGEQHAAAFTAISPNAKVPVIVDGQAAVFDSNAILLYLAEKTGQFPAEERMARRRIRIDARSAQLRSCAVAASIIATRSAAARCRRL